MSEQLFAVNLTDSNISLKTGYLSIPGKGFISITPADQEHPDFKYAFDRQWLTYSNTKPEAAVKEELEYISVPSVSQGLTIDELKQELANSFKEKNLGTVTALGQDNTPVGEATVTKLGGEVTEEVAEKVSEQEPVVEKKSRGSKKAAAAEVDTKEVTE